MKRTFVSIIFILTLRLIIAQTSQETEREKGWQGDIDTLLSLMKRQHYVYKSKPFPAELLTRAARLKETVNRLSDERLVFELEKLMYYMHDGHSYVLPFTTKRGPTYYLPIQFYLFNDGVFIIDAAERYKQLIGYKVQQINGIDVDTVINDMNSYIHQDNAYTVKWFAPTFMRFRGVYEMYGLPASSPAIGLRLIDRKNTSVLQTIEFEPVTSLQGIPKLIPSQLDNAPPAPKYLSQISKNYWLEYRPDMNMLYVQFNQVENDRKESLSDFSKRLDSALSAGKPRLFVIDVRNNNGGNKMLLRPLIDVIKRYGAENRSTRTIVITGRNTFSAAQVFISLLNKETNVVFAGEPSASSPNFVGEEGNMFLLPWSGAIGNISWRYHENIPGDTRKWIEPDFTIILSSKEYFENRDPVMEYIRKQFVH
ncbi:MAG: hypothetical protein WDA22_14335 [Bacteroidota bacterium]